MGEDPSVYYHPMRSVMPSGSLITLLVMRSKRLFLYRPITRKTLMQGIGVEYRKLALLYKHRRKWSIGKNRLPKKPYWDENRLKSKIKGKYKILVLF